MTAHNLAAVPQATRDRLASFGSLLRVERERRGLSQRAAAAEVGLSFSTVSRVESGDLLPDLHSFLALAAWARVPLGWFDADAGAGVDAWQRGWDECAAAVTAATRTGGAL